MGWVLVSVPHPPPPRVPESSGCGRKHCPSPMASQLKENKLLPTPWFIWSLFPRVLWVSAEKQKPASISYTPLKLVGMIPAWCSSDFLMSVLSASVKPACMGRQHGEAPPVNKRYVNQTLFPSFAHVWLWISQGWPSLRGFCSSQACTHLLPEMQEGGNCMKKWMNEEDIPVVQWIRICLSMQGRGFYSWARKIPHAWKILRPSAATTEPSCYSHCKPYALGPPSHRSEAPGILDSMLCNKRSHHLGKPKHSN